MQPFESASLACLTVYDVKISWFIAPTVALCEQQKSVIQTYLPVSVGLVSGSNEPDQWKDASLWERVLRTHRIMVSTPQVFLDALRHGYISLGKDISLMVFDEAHHAVDNHPYNRIMKEFYFDLPPRTQHGSSTFERPTILGLTASPIYGGNVIKAFECVLLLPYNGESLLIVFLKENRRKSR